MPRFATIVATGSYLPEIEISNASLRERFTAAAGNIDKLEAATGILKKQPRQRPDDGRHPTSHYGPRSRRCKEPEENQTMLTS